MDTLVEDQSSANAASVERATASPIQTVVSRGGGQNGTVPSAGIVSASSLTPGTQVRGNGTILLMPRSTEKNVASTASTTTQAIAVPQPGGGVSIVHVSIPSGTQPMHVQSVIQPNQQSVIQAPTGTGLHSFGKNVILVNKGSVIHSAEGDGGVHPVQLITAAKGDASDGDGITFTLGTGEDDAKKRREILARRPSYRKILNELSSTEHHGTVVSLEGGGTGIEVKQESATGGESSTQESDNSTAITSNTINVAGTQYHTAQVVPVSAIQLATGSQDGTLQGLQTLTMTNSGSAVTGAIVQYAQSQDGQQFLVPVTLSAADLQAYQIRTAGGITTAGLPQGVVMTSASNIQNPQQLAEETSRRRELRLLKNREAAKECRRKKKEYIKCLENRVAVLENQNKALIDELKSLKELYCQKND